MADLNNNGIPDELEYKDTRGTLIGYAPSPVPYADRTGTQLDEDERRAADAVVGSPAQGNGIENSHLVDDGISTESGGTLPAHTLGRKERRAVSPAVQPSGGPVERTRRPGGGGGEKS
jgi:hypothetical protein